MNRLPHTVSVLRRSGTTTDRYGNAVPATTATTTYRALLQQAGGTEDTRDRVQAVSQWLLLLEPAAAGNIDASDQVSHGGVTYEVVGPPVSWTFGHLHNRHVEARLRYVSG